MSPAELSILATLALYSAEGRSALTQNEIYLYLHKPKNAPGHSKPTEKEFADCLAEMKKNSLIFKEGDYYSRTHFSTDSKPRSERFSFSARRDKEAVVFPTATRSNEAMEENRQNPSGCGHSAPDTASLLLDVAKATPSSSAPCPDAEWKRIAAGGSIEMSSIENRAGFEKENIRKARQSAEKIKKNKWPLRFLRVVPFARAIAVTGSVAMQNARPMSDLDLLIIAQKGRIWTARIVALLILEILGRRREKSKEKICLNFFATEGAITPIQNIASANMLLRAIPLLGRKKYYEFLAQNRWTENFIYPTAKSASENERTPFIAKFFEYLLSGSMGNWLEQFFKDWQYKRLTGKITSSEHLDHFVLTDEILMLHYPNPKNAKIMDRFRVDR